MSGIRLNCLCGAISEPGTLLANNKLPQSTYLCHCDSCRYTTGSLGASFLPLASSPSQNTLSKLTAYASSAQFKRYFCTTCGCHCFIGSQQDASEWYCINGIIEQSQDSITKKEAWPKDVTKITEHDFVPDTKDGGFVPFLLDLYGEDIPAYVEGEGSSKLLRDEILSLPKQAKPSTGPDANSYLPYTCHCGGINFNVKRANWPDNSELGYIPSDRTKYSTSPCACRSCRLTTGTSMLTFTSVDPQHVFNTKASDTKDNQVLVEIGLAASEPGANPGLTLKHFQSSPDVIRSFCGTCGATVSYWNKQDPTELQLAVGLFRAEEGSMARQWLQWDWGRCTFSETCLDQGLVEAWTTNGKAVAEKIG